VAPVTQAALLVSGLVVTGLAIGIAFRSSLSAVSAMAPPDRRGEIVSAFFLACYTGLTLPVVIAGVLVTTTTLLTATVSLAVFVSVLALAALTVLVRRPAT
jgi:MFS family permease